MIKRIRVKLLRSSYGYYRPRVLGRVACLGNDIINLLGLSNGLINHQKSRVDYLIDIHQTTNRRCFPEKVYPFLEKKYVFFCIEQQKYDFFSLNRPDLIFIDSYSELTDQLFVNRNDGWCFLSNYSDIKHNQEFETKFICSGLMSSATVLDNYKIFFTKLTSSYPGVPVFYIHFPTTFDSRETFKHRGAVLLKAMKDIEVLFPTVKSICVEDKYVFKSTEGSDELKDFPYHYAKETYNKFVELVNLYL